MITPNKYLDKIKKKLAKCIIVGCDFHVNEAASPEGRVEPSLLNMELVSFVSVATDLSVCPDMALFQYIIWICTFDEVRGAGSAEVASQAPSLEEELWRHEARHCPTTPGHTETFQG